MNATRGKLQIDALTVHYRPFWVVWPSANGTSNWNHVKSRIPMMSYWPHRKLSAEIPCPAWMASLIYAIMRVPVTSASSPVWTTNSKRCATYNEGIDSSPPMVFTSLILSACEYVWVCACTHMYVLYMCMCVYVHEYVCVYVCVRAQIHVHNRRVTDALSNEYGLSVLMILGAWMRDLWKVNISLHMVHCNANEPWKNHPHSLLKQWITLQHVCQLKVAHGMKSTTFVNPFPYKRLQLRYNTNDAFHPPHPPHCLFMHP